VGEAGGIIASKLDRISRSVIDFYSMVKEAQAGGFTLVIVGDGFDLGTANGRAMAGMLAVFAQWEAEIIGERTKAGLAVVKARGPAPGKKPIGRPRSLPNSVVARIRRERSAGKSLTKIAEGLNADSVPTAQGGARWYASTVRKVLQQPN
jgi:DNA invertase Pin-like site-specific DNA recombinase